MNRLWRTVLIVGGVLILASVGTTFYATRHSTRLPDQFVQVDRPPRTSPDYQDCVIPPNIAPINFLVKEEGSNVRARIHADAGEEIVVGSRNGKIIIPLKRWKDLLAANVGGQIRVDVFVEDPETGWQRFETFSNQIAQDPIDPYVVYRLMGAPNHFVRPDMVSIERHIESFEERDIWVSTPGSCTNCHTFTNNDPSRMLLHLRGTDGTAMVWAEGDSIKKIDTRTSYNPPLGFTAWHPSGRVAAFSTNMLRLLHKSTGQSRANIDYKSDVGLYVLAENSVISTPDLSNPNRRETYPTWSPDGKTLYFASAEQPWPDSMGRDVIVPPEHRRIKYDLMRIDYDIDTGEWGELETVLSGDELGQSVSAPRISYDGRFLIFLGAPYGAFPTYLDSDLHILDLTTGEHRPMTEINSDKTDMRHSWSLNSRWIIFASKRRDGLFAKLYIAHIDENGRAGKAFLLPQEDPTYYDTLLKAYNAPELLTGPMKYGPEELGQVINPDVDAEPTDAITGATPDMDAPTKTDEQWDSESTLN
jgi:hypothetical protein